MKKKLVLPKFKNLKEEEKFWDEIDLGDFYDETDFEPVVFPNLKPTSKPISLRLPEMVLDRIKETAHAQGVPYQSLIKQVLFKEFLT